MLFQVLVEPVVTPTRIDDQVFMVGITIGDTRRFLFWELTWNPLKFSKKRSENRPNATSYLLTLPTYLPKLPMQMAKCDRWVGTRLHYVGM